MKINKLQIKSLRNNGKTNLKKYLYGRLTNKIKKVK